MEESVHISILGDGVSNITVTTETEEQDARTVAISYLMFKIGKPFHSKLKIPEVFLKKKQTTDTFFFTTYLLQEL